MTHLRSHLIYWHVFLDNDISCMKVIIFNANIDVMASLFHRTTAHNKALKSKFMNGNEGEIKNLGLESDRYY